MRNIIKMSSSVRYAIVSKILQVEYNDIENRSANLIREISKFIGLQEITADKLERIEKSLSKRAVKQSIESMESRNRDPAGKPASSDIVLGADDSERARIFDRQTGFQSGHVPDYQPGDWKKLWSDEQKAIVDDALRLAEKQISPAHQR